MIKSALDDQVIDVSSNINGCFCVLDEEISQESNNGPGTRDGNEGQLKLLSDGMVDECHLLLGPTSRSLFSCEKITYR